MYCLKCGYSLRHLNRSACPECGREFNTNDPSTYSDITLKSWRKRLFVGLAFLSLWACCWLIMEPWLVVSVYEDASHPQVVTNTYPVPFMQSATVAFVTAMLLTGIGVGLWRMMRRRAAVK